MLDETFVFIDDSSADEMGRPAAAGPAPAIDDDGRYVLGRLIGRGAFGEVREALDRLLGRRVAVKLPRRDRSGAEASLLREAVALAKLSHSGIEALYDYIACPGRPALVVELAAGSVLTKFIATRNCPLEAACRIVARLALALDHCHRHGVGHGDVKPGNVIVTPGGQPVLVDFGLSFTTGGRDGWRELRSIRAGSPAYMAPECFHMLPAAWGPAIDVYALGVVFYELLTGGRPFTGRIDNVMQCCLAGAVEPPTKRRPGIPPEVERLCLRLLNRDPAARPRDLRAFARDLRKHGLEGRQSCRRAS